MKRFRRIEITAFRRRVQIVSSVNQPSDDADEQNERDIWVNDAGTQETFEMESAEGQEILIEAVRLLKEKISEQAQAEIFAKNALTEIDFPKTL